MASSQHSMELNSLYVTRFALELAGVFLLAFALVTLLITYSLYRGARGGHGLGRAITMDGLLILCGIGLLLPRIWTKSLASILLATAGIWFLITDAQRSSYLGVYIFLLIPLPLTLWLWAGYRKFEIERLPSGNWLP